MVAWASWGSDCSSSWRELPLPQGDLHHLPLLNLPLQFKKIPTLLLVLILSLINSFSRQGGHRIQDHIGMIWFEARFNWISFDLHICRHPQASGQSVTPPPPPWRPLQLLRLMTAKSGSNAKTGCQPAGARYKRCPQNYHWRNTQIFREKNLFGKFTF